MTTKKEYTATDIAMFFCNVGVMVGLIYDGYSIWKAYLFINLCWFILAVITYYSEIIIVFKK